MNVVISLVVIHLAALAAWWTFTWQGLIAFAVMYQVSALGITVGYHRYLTHSSFKTYRPVQWILTLAGMSAGQGTPLEWVAVHEDHHVHSDTPDDPHSPHHGGFWWAHLGWMGRAFSTAQKAALFKRFAKRLLRNKEYRFVRYVSRERIYASWMLLTIAMIGGIGYALGGNRMCLSFLVYGVFVRLVVVYHITWAVNSVTHLWGYRRYETADQSRNNVIIGIIAQGEGWHNGHHYVERAANHGHRWWELDPSAWVIRILAKFGLAWNVFWYNPTTDKVDILYRR